MNKTQKKKARKPLTGLTPKRRERFLNALREGQHVVDASKECLVSRETLYSYRKKDETFRKEWEEAHEMGIDSWEREGLRRAVHGVDKPVYQGGQLVGYVKDYADTLLMFMLKGARPGKYRERQQVDLKADGKLVITWDE